VSVCVCVALGPTSSGAGIGTRVLIRDIKGASGSSRGLSGLSMDFHGCRISLRANRPSFDHEGLGTRFPCFSLVDDRAEYFVRLGAADGTRRGGDRACATRRGAKTFQGIVWHGMAWQSALLEWVGTAGMGIASPPNSSSGQQLQHCRAAPRTVLRPAQGGRCANGNENSRGRVTWHAVGGRREDG
jgi:hypothetical protein